MNSDYKTALLAIRQTLAAVEPKLSSLGGSLLDDCRLLRQHPSIYHWERERIIRHVHNSLTRVVANLPYPQLYQLALRHSTSKLWLLPSSVSDTESHRRRLLAYAMKNIIHALLG